MLKLNHILILCTIMLGVILYFLPNKPLKEKLVKVSGSDLNNEVSIEKAVSLINTSNPMEGIQMLKSIVEKDPKNTEALYKLAFFSMQSGQTDKAIERFNQILQVDSSKTDVLYYLAGIYFEQEQWEKSLIYLEKFKNKNTDQKVIEDLEKNIQEVKQKMNSYAKR